MSQDFSSIVRVDPRLTEWGVSLPALRLMVESPTDDGYVEWTFAGRVTWTDRTPTFGLNLLLLDDLGLPLEIDQLGFVQTVEPYVSVLKGWGYKQMDQPSEAQVVLRLED